MDYASNCEDPVVKGIIAEMNRVRRNHGSGPLRCQESATVLPMAWAGQHICELPVACRLQFGDAWHTRPTDGQCADIIGERFLGVANATTAQLIERGVDMVSNPGNSVRCFPAWYIGMQMTALKAHRRTFTFAQCSHVSGFASTYEQLCTCARWPTYRGRSQHQCSCAMRCRQLSCAAACLFESMPLNVFVRVVAGEQRAPWCAAQPRL